MTDSMTPLCDQFAQNCVDDLIKSLHGHGVTDKDANAQRLYPLFHQRIAAYQMYLAEMYDKVTVMKEMQQMLVTGDIHMTLTIGMVLGSSEMQVILPQIDDEFLAACVHGVRYGPEAASRIQYADVQGAPAKRPYLADGPADEKFQSDIQVALLAAMVWHGVPVLEAKEKLKDYRMLSWAGIMRGNVN